MAHFWMLCENYLVCLSFSFSFLFLFFLVSPLPFLLDLLLVEYILLILTEYILDLELKIYYIYLMVGLNTNLM